jgi:hypothetical protein
VTRKTRFSQRPGIVLDHFGDILRFNGGRLGLDN